MKKPADPTSRESLPSGHTRLPKWLRVKLPAGGAQATFNGTLNVVQGNELHTVCAEAGCPNIHECWAKGTATFMIGGKQCTRGCRFCSVETIKQPDPLDADEPERLANAIERMGVAHVVITVVNRDDLPDGGADHFKQCVSAVHHRLPDTTIELLCSDLDGNWSALAHLLDKISLCVFAHNVECVPRLDRLVRDPRASFDQSLEVLRKAKEMREDIWTKSSLMVGVGETNAEISDAMQQLRNVGVELLTLGQYLSPGRDSTRFLPIDRFVTPKQFDFWAEEARTMGFRSVASGPLVRSSYQAGFLLKEAETGHLPT